MTLTTRRAGEGVYRVRTDSGTYTVTKRYDGGSQFTWVVTGADLAAPVERDTKRAAVAWIAEHTAPPAQPEPPMTDAQRTIRNWLEARLGPEVRVTRLTGFTARHEEHHQGWDHGPYDSVSCTPGSAGIEVGFEGVWATAGGYWNPGDPYPMTKWEFADEDLSAVAVLLNALLGAEGGVRVR